MKQLPALKKLLYKLHSLPIYTCIIIVFAYAFLCTACEKTAVIENDKAFSDEQIMIDAMETAEALKITQCLPNNVERYGGKKALNVPIEGNKVSFSNDPIILKLRQYFAGFYATAYIADSIKIDTSNKVKIASYYAEGYQIYEVRRNAATNAIEWAFVAPVAKLYNNGKKVGTHFVGPTWLSTDSSSVAGTVQIISPSVIAPEFNIPWLLLKNKANTGKGIFSNVVAIQRLSTIGGQRRNPQLLTEANIGKVKDSVPYTALYNFYKNK